MGHEANRLYNTNFFYLAVSMSYWRVFQEILRVTRHIMKSPASRVPKGQLLQLCIA
jgi:hypothetical protein